MAGTEESLGKIRVEVEATLERFSKGLDDARKMAEDGAKKIERQFQKTAEQIDKNNRSAEKSFGAIDAAILNNVKSTNDLIQVNDKLFLEVSKKTGKVISTYRILNGVIEQNIRGNVQGWQKIANVGETALNRTARSVNVFGNASKNLRGGVRLLTYEIANAAGQTGRFGSLIGQLAGGMLVGGWIGAGLAAGATAINLIAQNTQKLTETIKEAISRIVSFKDKFKDIKFEVDTGNISEQTKFIENRIKQLQKNISERDVSLLKLRSTEGSSDVSIKILEKQNELDEKRIAVNEEYLDKLKEQKDLEDALGVTKSELNKIGVKELTVIDQINSELKDQKKLIDDLKITLADPNVKGEARLVLQNKLNQAQEDYNSLLGRQRETQKNAIDEIVKKIQTETELKRLTDQLSVSILLTSKKTLESSLELAKNDEERLKLLQAIALVEKEIQDRRGKQQRVEPDIEGRGVAENILKREQEAQQELKRLKISAVEDEFAQREAFIELEFENLNEHYKELFENRLISESELQEALANNQKAKEIELARVARDKFDAGLSATRNIASILHNAFGDNTLINQLNRALEIAEQIAAVIKSINLLSTLFGNPAGASAALASGGSVVNTGGSVRVTPWRNVPKFAGGVNDFIVPSGFPNDSFPIRVQSGERVTVTPAHEVPNLGVSNSEMLRVLNGIYNRVGVLNMNVSSLEMKVDIVNNAPDVNTQVRRNKKVENKLTRNGIKFNEQ